MRNFIFRLFILISIAVSGIVRLTPAVASTGTDDTQSEQQARIPIAETMGKVYYLIVGIGKYQARSFPRLTSPVKDAKAIAKILPSAYPGDVTLFINKEATKANIKAAFDRIRRVIQPNDRLIFYFSGHGRSTVSVDRQKRWNFFQPVDSNKENFRQDISNNELNEWLMTFPVPEHITVILDSCFSGGFFPTTNEQEEDRMPAGYTVLSASAKNEYSMDTNKGSLFTKQLLDGLTKHKNSTDLNRDNIINARELFEYAAPRTTNAAQKLHEQQHPQLFTSGNPALFAY